MLQVQNLYKSFKDPQQLQVLNDISLNIKPGEFVSIVGPSGCGKTTLLNVIGNLENLSSGLIAFKSSRPRISFLFQQPSLLNWRNVTQNIALPLELIGNQSVSTKEFIGMAGLNRFENYFPNQLSGGMQQRVALVRALSTNPDLLLMDEPFSSIDDLSREQLCLELQQIWQKTKTTILFVTHNLEEAVFLSDRVVVLSERPAQIKKVVPIFLSRPRNLTVKHTPTFQGYIKWIKKIMRE